MKKRYLFGISCILSLLSVFFVVSMDSSKYYYGFPLKFIETTKEIFLYKRFYFLNPIYTLQNALIKVFGLIFNIAIYYLLISFIIKLTKKDVK